MGLRVTIQGLSAILVASLALATTASAQVDQASAGNEKPMYWHSPKKLHPATSMPAGPQLPTWNGYFIYDGKKYSYNMVGKAPSSGISTTVPVDIIPIKIVITGQNGVTTTFDPAVVVSNGNTVVSNTVASPIFQAIPFTSGGVSMGTTQYIDAFRRANFWGTVQKHPGYHLLLGGPEVLAEQTLSPPPTNGTTGIHFGVNAGLVDVDWYDAQIETLITSLGIPPNTLAIFLTYDVYLTQGGQCCIGGYHGVTGPTNAARTYAHATYVDHVGAFSQDVSAVSHEVGEWADDPLLVDINGNNTPCGPLENGDPLVLNANFGAFAYQGTNGFTYNLQDLVTLPYFGAPPSTSVNGEFTFQGEGLTVCELGF